MFSKIVRHVSERGPSKTEKVQRGWFPAARAEARRHRYRARFPDSSGRIQSQIKRGQRA